MRLWRLVCAAVVSVVAASGAGMPRLLTGVISSLPNAMDNLLGAPRKIALTLDRDGYPGQKRGDTIIFELRQGVKVTSRGKEVGMDAMRVRQQANIYYDEDKSGRVVREIQLLGMLPPSVPLPGANTSPPRSGSAARVELPPSRSGEAPGRGVKLADPEKIVKLTEVRLQRSDRQGDANIDSVRSDTNVWVAFYVRVDAVETVRLAYRCGTANLEKIKRGAKPGDDLDLLKPCNFEETVPAGFHGLRYHAFPIKTAAPKGERIAVVIAGEVAPVVSLGAGEVRPYQRKLQGLYIQN